MSAFIATQFENEFPAQGSVRLHNKADAVNILSDVQGFLAKHKIEDDILIIKKDHVIVIIGNGTIHSEYILTITDSKLISNLIYGEDDVEAFIHELSWRHLRRIISTMIRNI